MPSGTAICPRCNRHLPYALDYQDDGRTVLIHCPCSIHPFNWIHDDELRSQQTIPAITETEIFTCTHCNRTYLSSRFQATSEGLKQCPYCGFRNTPYSDENPAPTIAKCHRCNSDTQRDAHRLWENHFYCEQCFDLLFTHCSVCNNVIRHDRAMERNENTYCRSCFDDNFFHCHHCGDTISRQDTDFYVYNDYPYCQECYDSLFTTCDNCDNVFRSEEATTRRGRTLCPHCVTNNATWDIYRLPLPRGEFRFGIELETSECPDSAGLQGETCFGCQRDGSIDGMEFISPPLAGKLGFDKINEFLKLAEKNKFQVDEKCGFHLHLNMDGLSMSDLQKIIYAYYLSEDVWRLFIREDRKNNHYCQKIAWKIENIFNCETHSEFVNLLHRTNDGVGRYCWFNILAYFEHHTFEIRSHEGTLDQAAIENWIKLHITFCQWAMAHTFEQIEKTMTHINLNKVKSIIQDDSLVMYYANKIGLGIATENIELQAA